MRKAFTLVELLIVIALIAILSVAVLATINPIEQTNKARDASMKNDAAEVLNAYERYYASQNAYPWNLTVGYSVPTTFVGAFDSTSPNFGVVMSAGGTDGALVQTSELKSAFESKTPFVANVLDSDHMYVFHSNAGNNYVCYTPKANANRTASVGLTLKCLSGTGDGATLTSQDTNCVIPNPWTNAISATNANLLCVPEGNIQ